MRKFWSLEPRSESHNLHLFAVFLSTTRPQVGLGAHVNGRSSWLTPVSPFLVAVQETETTSTPLYRPMFCIESLFKTNARSKRASVSGNLPPDAPDGGGSFVPWMFEESSMILLVSKR